MNTNFTDGLLGLVLIGLVLIFVLAAVFFAVKAIVGGVGALKGGEEPGDKGPGRQDRAMRIATGASGLLFFVFTGVGIFFMAHLNDDADLRDEALQRALAEQGQIEERIRRMSEEVAARKLHMTGGKEAQDALVQEQAASDRSGEIEALLRETRREIDALEAAKTREKASDMPATKAPEGP